MLTLWKKTSRQFFFLISFIYFLASCSAPRLDCTTEDGKQACMDEISLQITKGNCSKAIELADQLYATKYTDNQVRLLRASAHGCAANISFFSLLETLSTSSSSLGGLNFWSIMTELFRPDSSISDFTMDGRIEAGWQAAQSVFAALSSGSEVSPGFQINWTSGNPGSTASGNRIDDANLMMMVVSMSIIGNTQNRFGNPDTSNNQVTSLPWQTSDLLSDGTQQGDFGCEYAGSVIHLIDSIDAVSGTVQNTGVKTALTNMSSLLRDGVGVVPGINEACDLGCRGRDMLDTVDFDATCTYDSGDCNPCEAGDTECIQCPTALRDRAGCKSNAKAACAGAGIVRFMDLGWQ